MPAVTAEVTTLPRVPEAAPGDTVRPTVKVIASHRQLEGAGFPVRRPFPGVDLSLADPFVLLDQMGEVDYAPGEARGAPWHPHRGFETVTYMIDGTFEHHDSTGGGGVIRDGDTQWMTAGAGLLHDEMPPEELVRTGGRFHGVQLWVNLPAAKKWSPPAYQDIRAEKVALLASADAGAIVRLIAGDLAGHAGPGNTQTPITYAHATLEPGARLTVPWRAEFNALVYALSGNGRVGSDDAPLRDGQLAVLGAGDVVTLTADRGQPLDVLLLGGEPIREPIARYGPFVMNTKAEIAQAVEDFQAGRMGTIPTTS